MIYLKPVGGLCNRMRSIESMVSWCKKYERDLTVLWVKDNSLNCPFVELFEMPKFPQFKFKIIDCPVGYPELYIKNFEIINNGVQNKSIWNSYLVRKIKNSFKGRNLTPQLAAIKGVIQKMKSSSVLTNYDLGQLYASDTYGRETSAREIDNDFIKIISPKIKKLFELQLPVFISSCYRFHLLQGSYEDFNPLPSIKKSMEKTLAQFNEDTLGLHIRRSDHRASKTVSTTDKFIETIDAELLQNPSTNFFLSTDDAGVKSQLFERYGKKIVVNKISSYDRNNKAAVKNALIDLYCLAHTKKIYGSHHSSFSQTAADIGNIQEITAR